MTTNMNSHMARLISEMVAAESVNNAATIERKNASTAGDPRRWARAITASIAAQQAYSAAVYRVQTAEIVAKTEKAVKDHGGFEYQLQDRTGRVFGKFESRREANDFRCRAEAVMTNVEIRNTNFRVVLAEKTRRTA